MEEENLQNQNDIQPTIEPISKTDAMVGVFTEPANTFENIAMSKGVSYWLMPVLICMIIGLISAFIMNSDPQLTREIKEKADKKMNEQFEEAVKGGKMTAADVESAKSMSYKITAIAGWVGPMIMPFIVLLIMSLIYFIILKIFKSPIEFTSVMNVVGLTMIIGSIGGLIAMVLSVVMGHFVSVSPGIFLPESSVGIKLHTLVSHFDLFSIWGLIVTTIGISKVGRSSMGIASVVVLIPWAIWAIATTLMA
jgi:hypothetical protein